MSATLSSNDAGRDRTSGGAGLPARTVFLARLIGLFLSVLSVSMLLNKALMLAAITATVNDPQLMLFYGVITLAPGLAIVIGHNTWSQGPVASAVTAVGWLVLIKSAVFLLMSQATIMGLFEVIRFADFYFGYVAAIMAVGLYMTWAGFRSPLVGQPVSA